ncbi:MAG: cupin domain-containing protein [Formosimonas sp.]
MKQVQLFSDQQPQAEFDYPRPERLVTGNPQRTTWHHFTNDSGEVFMGVWASEVGAWRIEMSATEDEYFYVLEGSGHLTDDSGQVRTFGVGDAVIIPAGYTGVFTVIEPLTKHYVITERKA